MELSKKENKKINYLKELSNYKLFLDNIFIKDKTARQILVSAYNKLERQQKEIKKEKSRIMELAELLDKQENEIKFLKRELEIQEGCSISKDKIREKIKKAKEIKWHTPKLVIEYFEELLEEN